MMTLQGMGDRCLYVWTVMKKLTATAKFAHIVGLMRRLPTSGFMIYTPKKLNSLNKPMTYMHYQKYTSLPIKKLVHFQICMF
jgi:hypothetical protein